MVSRKVKKLSPKIQLSQERLSKFLGKQYVLLTIFWIIFTAMLIYVLILFIQERGMVNNTPEISKLLNQLKEATLTNVEKQEIYKQLIKLTVYPIIDFSLMKFDFFGTKTDVVDWEAAWNDRIKNINLAYSYVFISATIALIALFFYILINIKNLRRRLFEKKYQLSTVYPNNYFIFNTKIYLDFITSLTIVFCFFNFITTIIAIIYGIFNVVISTLNRWIFKVDSPAFLPRKWWRGGNFGFFVMVLVIQNSYTIAKSYFATQFDVDIDIIVSIIIPIGTITVIVAIFIRNMMAAKVTAVKTIMVRVMAFKIYVHSQDDKVFSDYSFMRDMPIIIKERFLSKTINNKQGLELLGIIDETVEFFRLNIKKPDELNYMLFHLFNDVHEIAEIEEMRHNILKVKSKK